MTKIQNISWEVGKSNKGLQKLVIFPFFSHLVVSQHITITPADLRKSSKMSHANTSQRARTKARAVDRRGLPWAALDCRNQPVNATTNECEGPPIICVVCRRLPWSSMGGVGLVDCRGLLWAALDCRHHSVVCVGLSSPANGLQLTRELPTLQFSSCITCLSLD